MTAQAEFPEPAESLFATEVLSASEIVTSLPKIIASADMDQKDGVPEAPTALSAATVFLAVGVVGLRRRILLERHRPERRKKKTDCRQMA